MKRDEVAMARAPSGTRSTSDPHSLSSAEKFPERFKYTAGESCCFLGETLELLSERPLLAPMNLAGTCWHFIGGQIGIVRGSG
jgi:hypothetical protein